MALPTPVGKVTVWGIDGTIAFSGLTADGYIMTDVGVTDGFEEHKVRDQAGKTVGIRLWDQELTCEVTFIPAKDAGAGSIAASKDNVILPAPGSKVTIAAMPFSADGSSTANPNLTTWLYLGGGRINLTNQGEVKITLPLRKYDTDLAATANS